MELQQLGKLLLVLALGMAVLGAALWLGGRLGLGSLPGDFRFQGRGWSCFFPLATSILLSILLTLLLSLALRFFR